MKKNILKNLKFEKKKNPSKDYIEIMDEKILLIIEDNYSIDKIQKPFIGTRDKKLLKIKLLFKTLYFDKGIPVISDDLIDRKVIMTIKPRIFYKEKNNELFVGYKYYCYKIITK